MTMKEILIESDHGRDRLALAEDGKLLEIYADQDGGRLQGRIYLGRVMNVLPGMQAAFVDIGLEKHGFLPTEDFPPREDGKPLRNGQEIVVQVIKDIGGEKGPRLTGKIALPGRYMVLLPGGDDVGVSHKIEDAGERDRLRRIAESFRREGSGLIVRTAAQDAGEDSLRQDAGRLYALWESLLRKAECGKAPALLFRDETLAAAAVRDMMNDGVDALYADSEALYEEARSMAEICCPQWLSRVRRWDGPGPLFEAKHINYQITEAISRKVWLKSGGYLVIDPTEALTVIDVNSGKYVGKDSLEDTAFAVNCEAALEIARQLRLRDVGGIIVIDFIDMERPEKREALLEALREALRDDPSRVHVEGITSLGLVEMTRKRARETLRRRMTRPCPVCGGDGAVISEDAQAHDALLLVKSAKAHTRAEAYVLEAPRFIVEYAMRLAEAGDENVWLKTGDKVAVTPCRRQEVPGDARRLWKV